ncbi:MAG: hypothetical protein QOE37_2213 [Microbacteriaceae bacterium]|nr:hypothetical protein [Microbacteriaceae bacterium]
MYLEDIIGPVLAGRVLFVYFFYFEKYYCIWPYYYYLILYFVMVAISGALQQLSNLSGIIQKHFESLIA